MAHLSRQLAARTMANPAWRHNGFSTRSHDSRSQASGDGAYAPEGRGRPAVQARASMRQGPLSAKTSKAAASKRASRHRPMTGRQSGSCPQQRDILLDGCELGAQPIPAWLTRGAEPDVRRPPWPWCCASASFSYRKQGGTADNQPAQLQLQHGKLRCRARPLPEPGVCSPTAGRSCRRRPAPLPHAVSCWRARRHRHVTSCHAKSRGRPARRGDGGVGDLCVVAETVR